jgi:hypothetical protein
MNIKELAEQANIPSFWLSGVDAKGKQILATFSELIAAHEREECAKLMFDIGSAKLTRAIRERNKA